MKRIAGWIESHLTLRVFLPLLAVALLATWYGLGLSLEHIKSVVAH